MQTVLKDVINQPSCLSFSFCNKYAFIVDVLNQIKFPIQVDRFLMKNRSYSFLILVSLKACDVLHFIKENINNRVLRY